MRKKYTNSLVGKEKIPVVVTGKNVSVMEIFAARELQKYILQLTGKRLKIKKDIQLEIDGKQPLILVGNIMTNRLIREIAQRLGLQKMLHSLEPQEFILKSMIYKNNYILIVTGGSPVGTMYAVYELLEQYGIQFHTIGDILPEEKIEFRLIDIDTHMTPVIKRRGFSTFLNFLEGPASWGINEYKQYIDQMAKMKFNFLTFYFYAYAPWLDFKYRGVKNIAENPDYGQRFPITKELIGLEQLDTEREFNSPVLVGIEKPQEMFEKAQSLIRQVINYAHKRGIEVGVSMELNELPEDIKAMTDKLKEWSKKPNPDWRDVTDPVIQTLMTERFKTLVKRYPHADAYFMYQLEGRSACQNNGDCSNLLKTYEKKYARCLHNYPYTVEPAKKIKLTKYLQADIEYLHLLNKLFIENKSLRKLIKKDARIVTATWFAQPTFPVIAKLLPQDMVFSCILDYGTSLTLKHIKYLRYFKNKPFEKWLITWIESDCVSWFPQFSVQSLYKTMKEAKKYSLDGIFLLFWRVNGLEHNTRYFSKVAWDSSYTPDKFYEEYLPIMFGKEANSRLLKEAFQFLEKEQPVLVERLVNIAFPHKRVLLDYMEPDNFKISDVERARDNFFKAVEAFKKAEKDAKGFSRERIKYYINKFTFCVQYLEAVGYVLEAKKNLKSSQHVIHLMEKAIERAKESVLNFSRNISDRGEKGALVKLNYFFYQGLQEMKESMEEEIKGKDCIKERGEYYPTLVKEGQK